MLHSRFNVEAVMLLRHAMACAGRSLWLIGKRCMIRSPLRRLHPAVFFKGSGSGKIAQQIRMPFCRWCHISLPPLGSGRFIRTVTLKQGCGVLLGVCRASCDLLPLTAGHLSPGGGWLVKGGSVSFPWGVFLLIFAVRAQTYPRA